MMLFGRLALQVEKQRVLQLSMGIGIAFGGADAARKFLEHE